MKRILLVDDNESFRAAFAKIIERSGYLVTQATDVRAGLIYFRAETPDLVICDLIMPDVEDMQTIQEMLHRRPDARIVAISGGGRIKPLDSLRLANQMGVVGTVAKPFADDELLSVTAHAIGPGEATAASSRSN